MRFRAKQKLGWVVLFMWAVQPCGMADADGPSEVLIQWVAYAKMCRGPSCAQPVVQPSRVRIELDSRGRGHYEEAYQLSAYQLVYRFTLERNAFNGSFGYTLLTEYQIRGRSFQQEQERGFIDDLDHFSPIRVSGHSVVDGGYEYFPLVEVSPVSR